MSQTISLSLFCLLALVAASCQGVDQVLPTASPAHISSPTPGAGIASLSPTPPPTLLPVDTSQPNNTATTSSGAISLSELARGEFFRGLTLDPSGKTLYFLGTIDGTSALWVADLSTSIRPRNVSDAHDAIDLSISPDNTLAALGGELTLVIALQSGEILYELPTVNQYCLVDFLAATSLARACTTVGEEPATTRLEVLDLVTNEIGFQSSYPGFPRKVTGIAGSSVVILSTSAESPGPDEVTSIDLSDGSILCQLASTRFGGTTSGTGYVAVAKDNGNIEIIDMRTCSSLRSVSLGSPRQIPHVSGDADFLLVGSGSNIWFVEFATGGGHIEWRGDLPADVAVGDVVGIAQNDAFFVLGVESSTSSSRIFMVSR